MRKWLAICDACGTSADATLHTNALGWLNGTIRRADPTRNAAVDLCPACTTKALPDTEEPTR